jgi:hypothetical protein
MRNIFQIRSKEKDFSALLVFIEEDDNTWSLWENKKLILEECCLVSMDEMEVMLRGNPISSERENYKLIFHPSYSSPNVINLKNRLNQLPPVTLIFVFYILPFFLITFKKKKKKDLKKFSFFFFVESFFVQNKQLLANNFFPEKILFDKNIFFLYKQLNPWLKKKKIISKKK